MATIASVFSIQFKLHFLYYNFTFLKFEYLYLAERLLCNRDTDELSFTISRFSPAMCDANTAKKSSDYPIKKFTWDLAENRVGKPA